MERQQKCCRVDLSIGVSTLEILDMRFLWLSSRIGFGAPRPSLCDAPLALNTYVSRDKREVGTILSRAALLWILTVVRDCTKKTWCYFSTLASQNKGFVLAKISQSELFEVRYMAKAPESMIKTRP